MLLLPLMVLLLLLLLLPAAVALLPDAPAAWREELDGLGVAAVAPPFLFAESAVVDGGGVSTREN